MNDLKTVRPEIIVALDCDEKGRKTALAIKAQFTDVGIKTRAVDLGLSRGGDLADHCSLHTDNALQALLSRPDLPEPVALGAVDRSFRFVSAAEAMNLPPTRWLLKKLLVWAGLLLLYGPSGVGKSFIMLGLVYQIALEHRVVYVASENESDIGTRYEALVRFHGRAEPEGNLTFVFGAIDLSDAVAVEMFIQLLAEYRPTLVIFDTLAANSGATDENNSRDMKRVLEGCNRIMRTLDCAVGIVHHTNKGGRQESGWKGLYNHSDTVIRVLREDDTVLVETKKIRQAVEPKPYSLRAVTVDLGKFDADGTPLTSLVYQPAELVQVDPGMVSPVMHAALEAVQVDAKITVRDLGDLLEINNPGTVHKLIKKLAKFGYLYPRAADGALKLTPAGESAVSDDVADVAPLAVLPPLTGTQGHEHRNSGNTGNSGNGAASTGNGTLFDVERNYYREGK